MSHVVLLGDCIFDNRRYTGGGPDVISQVRRALPPGWQATLLAIDGSVADDVPRQVGRLPPDATHLVLSVGGNDALLQASVLDEAVSSAAQAFGLLADVRNDFEPRYRAAVAACLRPAVPLALCTIYNGRFPDPAYQRLATVAVTIFNDVILGVAIEHALPVIDLRAICVDYHDYANSIEPSSQGGEKIARAIAALLTEGNTPVRAARIVSG